MSAFQITVVNDEFAFTSEEEVSDFDEARASGMKGALEVGIEQILAGKELFGAEITVSNGDVRERFVVSIATSKLKC